MNAAVSNCPACAAEPDMIACRDCFAATVEEVNRSLAPRCPECGATGTDDLWCENDAPAAQREYQCFACGARREVYNIVYDRLEKEKNS